MSTPDQRLQTRRQEEEVRRKVDGVERAGEEDITDAFGTIVKEGKAKTPLSNSMKKDKSLRHLKDETNFIPYQAADQHTEAGYSMMTGFSAQAR